VFRTEVQCANGAFGEPDALRSLAAGKGGGTSMPKPPTSRNFRLPTSELCTRHLAHRVTRQRPDNELIGNLAMGQNIRGK